MATQSVERRAVAGQIVMFVQIGEKEEAFGKLTGGQAQHELDRLIKAWLRQPVDPAGVEALL